MLTLDGSPLGVDNLVAVARDGVPVEIGEVARRRMAPSLALIERLDAGVSPSTG